MAVLPAQIVWSRSGLDCSYEILFSLLAVYFAFQANAAGLAVPWLFSMWAHPTGLFLAPALMLVYLARSWASYRTLCPLGRFSGWLGGIDLACLVAAIAGIVAYQKSNTKQLYEVYQLGYAQHHDWREFWYWFDRLYLGLGRAPHPLHDRLFWPIVLPVVAGCSIALARKRQWDRLALVVGVILSGVVYCLFSGSTIMQFGMHRYGLFLVTPAVLALACLVRSLLASRGTIPGRLVYPIQITGLLALAWILPFSIRLENLDGYGAVPGTIWTFGGGEHATYQLVLRGILRDTPRSGAGALPRTVIAEDWESYQSLRYLAANRKAVRVVHLPELAPAEKLINTFYPVVSRILGADIASLCIAK